MIGTEIEYFKSDSVVHRLHPFVKFVFILAVFVVVAFFSDVRYEVGVITVVMLVAAAAGIGLRKFSYMWVVGYVGLFLIFTQGIWFTSFGSFGGSTRAWHTLFHLWPGWMPGGPRVPFVYEGAIYGASLALRFVAIALAFPILVMTTHPSDLVTSLAQVRMKGYRIPYSLIFVFATALRYVPTVSRSFEHTMDAQRTRGVVFDGWNVLARARAYIPLLVPVIVSSMVHAQDLTIALESRAFGASTERTFRRVICWTGRDTVVTVAVLVVSVACVVASVTHGFGLLAFAPERHA